jgi:hypothetical protein
MSELLTRPNNTIALFACGGKSVNNRSHVCDDWIDVPLGMLTLSGMCAAFLLMHGDVTEIKLLEHLESSIAVSSIVAVNMVGVQFKVNGN